MLPKPLVGSIIHLTMAHAILASGVCYRIAKALNKDAVKALGGDGLVHMSAFYSLFSTQHEFRRTKHLHPESSVNHFLSNRYRVKKVTNLEIIDIAKRLGIWTDITKRVRAIYPLMKF